MVLLIVGLHGERWSGRAWELGCRDLGRMCWRAPLFPYLSLHPAESCPWETGDNTDRKLAL